jgi:hypothetical protein
MSAFPSVTESSAPQRGVASAGDPRGGGDQRDAPFGFVTAQRLIGLGIIANTLFWCGLLIPFNGAAIPEIAFLHAMVAMLGLGLAFGGAVAVVMMVVHQVTVKLFSPELIAAVAHFTVVIAFATLCLSAVLRGWAID